MIRRYILHVEVHRGYWPKISLRRAPRAAVDLLGALGRCKACRGTGFRVYEEGRVLPGYQDGGVVAKDIWKV